MKEIRVSLDTKAAVLNLYCDHGKEYHCQIGMDEISQASLREENNPLRSKDKYHFMEI